MSLQSSLGTSPNSKIKFISEFTISQYDSIVLHFYFINCLYHLIKERINDHLQTTVYTEGTGRNL